MCYYGAFIALLAKYKSDACPKRVSKIYKALLSSQIGVALIYL